MRNTALTIFTVAIVALMLPFTSDAKGGGKGRITPKFNVAAKPATTKSHTFRGSGSVISSRSTAARRIPLTPRGKIATLVPAKSANAKIALQKKFSGLSNAQQRAAKARTLNDGRVRYYTKETEARTKGKTRGASLVTEHSPRNGRVRQWMESYGHKGQVLRVHPKSFNGQPLKSPHFPPTARELGK